MRVRPVLFTTLGVSVAVLCTAAGNWSTQQRMATQIAQNEERVAALRHDLALALTKLQDSSPAPVGTAGTDADKAGDEANKAKLIEQVKQQLQREMGLLPLQLIRDRRESFVELNTLDNNGRSGYGTAGYLGDGYFITVKHAVVALDGGTERDPRRITSITIRNGGKDRPARVIDSGDANVEVHKGDWAIIRVRGEIDLRPLALDLDYQYEFADPIFRLGNDYSKGIMLGTGYVGQRTSNGLVTCLTDGHPGVSGGGVLNQEGKLVGIQIGRMEADYRFSFILPLRSEMFRKIPITSAAQPQAPVSD
jgi:hypothetical protein